MQSHWGLGLQCRSFRGDTIRSVTQDKTWDCSIEQGSPTPGPWADNGPRPVRNWTTQQEVSSGQVSEASSAAPHRSRYRLNHHPYPPAPPTVEKLSSMKLVPSAKKVGDHWGRVFKGKNTIKLICWYPWLEHKLHEGRKGILLVYRGIPNTYCTAYYY